MPFVAMLIFLLMASIGISTDLTRDFEAASQLEFAAQTVALYALSLATNSDGSYSLNNAQSNIQSAVSNASSFAWNSAQFGPQNNVWSKPVTFSSSDIQFVNNPLDPSEFFVELTARRPNSDSLQQFFLPLTYTNFFGGALPLSKVNPAKTIEVFGQPASRIGAGVLSGAQTVGRAADFIGFASLPIAIGNQQFAAISNSSQTTLTYTVDIVSSTSSGTAGHIKGCFVNVSGIATSNGISYGSGQGIQAINQLIGLLGYFSGQNGQASVAPAVVERGSVLNAFDPANSVFVQQQTKITQAVSQLPINRYYIVPVLAANPSFAANSNVVVGFARLKLDQVILTGGVVTGLSMDIGESVPLRNASSATGFSTVSGAGNTPMPAPVAPFAPRQYDPNTNGITVRPRGIVLAPALSPRQINPS